MKKSKRKSFIIHLIFISAVCCLFFDSTISHATTYTDGYLTYTENEDGTLTVTGYDRALHESPYNLFIPEEYYPEEESDPKIITAIGEGVFKDYTFYSIYIEGTVSIGAHSFENITVNNYKHESNVGECVRIDNISTIGDYAFANATFNSDVNLYTIDTIGNHAFENVYFSNDTLANSIRIIGDAAFKNSNITTLWPNHDKIESIGSEAFYGTNLKSYSIYNTLTHIGANAFPYPNTTNHNIPYEESFSFTIDARITDLTCYDFDFTAPGSENFIFHLHKDSPLISWCENNYFYYKIIETNVDVPPRGRNGEIVSLNKSTSCVITGNDTAALSKYCYDESPDTYNLVSMDSLKDFQLRNYPYVIDTINSNAIKGTTIDCFDMRKSNIICIRENAFADCPRISMLYLPDRIETIEENAFPNQKGLTIVIPSTVTNITNFNFSNLTNVTFQVNYGSPVISQLDALNLSYKVENAPKEPSADTSQEQSVADTSQEQPVTDTSQEQPVTDTMQEQPVGEQIILHNMCYQITGKQTATFLKTLRKNVSSLTIPATITWQGSKYNVTKINKKACYQLKMLKKVTIGNNVSQVGDQAFAKCSRLKTITFGKNIKRLGKMTLYKDKNLQTITFQTKKLTAIGKKTFRGVPKKVNIRIPNSKVKKYSKIIYKAQ